MLQAVTVWITVIVDTNDAIITGRLDVTAVDPELPNNAVSARDVLVGPDGVDMSRSGSVVVVSATGEVSPDMLTPFVADPTFVAASVEPLLPVSSEHRAGNNRLSVARDHETVVVAVDTGKVVSVLVKIVARDVVIVVEDSVTVTSVVLVCSVSNIQPTRPKRCSFMEGFSRPPVILAWLHVDVRPEHCLVRVSASFRLENRRGGAHGGRTM